MIPVEIEQFHQNLGVKCRTIHDLLEYSQYTDELPNFHNKNICALYDNNYSGKYFPILKLFWEKRLCKSENTLNSHTFLFYKHSLGSWFHISDKKLLTD